MERQRRPIAQGDVLLVPVDENEIPKEATPKARDKGRLVIAYGEVTGHMHQIMEPGSATFDGQKVVLVRDAPAKDKTAEILTAKGGAVLVRAYKKAQLVHEEHAPIDVEPGTYRYAPQTEWTAWGERRVAD